MQTCLDSVQSARGKARPLIDDIESGKISSDFMEKVNEFLRSMDEVGENFSKFPSGFDNLKADVTKKDQAIVGEMIKTLITELEVLLGEQVVIIRTLKDGIQDKSDQMEIIRKAKNIFNNFIKKPKQDPFFFDRMG